MKLYINLTPHTINVYEGGILVNSFPPNGEPARISIKREKVMEQDGVSFYHQAKGPVEGLPSEREDTFYIVSTLVRLEVPSRKDLLSPGDLLRDGAGKPIGCDGFDFN